MAYDWSKNAGGEQAPRLPVGEEADVQITKVVYGKKDGTLFTTQYGDPKIMVIFADDLGRECAFMLTLSAKAGFRLASILSCSGVDLDRMFADGVEPHFFADEGFGNANLIGRRLRIRVASYVGSDGNLAEKIVPLHRTPGLPALRPTDPVAQAVNKAVENQSKEGPPAADEIPF